MRNNWLSYVISETTRDELHKICINISKVLNFNSMSYDGLHMTAVFMGKYYKSKDYDKIFKLIEDEKLSGHFEFDRLEFFPPTKKNLIVAIFKTTKEVELKLKSLKTKMREELKYEIDDDDFVPHITLGKINSTKKDLEILIKKNPLVELMSSIHDKSFLSFDINTESPLYLCGEVK